MRPMFSQCISNNICPPPCPPSGISSAGNSAPPGTESFFSPFSPYSRRQNSYFASADLRIYEINKRLQQRTEESDNLWWDSFATEFFGDDATLTIAFCLEDGPKRYSIGRTLIPRYFRSLFEGGVTDLSFQLKHSKESFHNTTVTLDCDQCSIITHLGKPPFNKGIGSGPFPPGVDPQQMKDQLQMNKDNSVIICTEGRLLLEFAFDDGMRIKSWHFTTRHHQELISRELISCIAQQDPSLLEQVTKNITRHGFSNSTLNYLRLCVILEPMQELMSRHKAFALSPRDCLKTTLFQKWQRTVTTQENQRPPSKRRKRKSSASNNANSGNTGKKKNNSSMSPGPPPNFPLASQDVMVVGEPSMMGGDFGVEDERLITRLENSQYDPTAAGVSNGLEDGDDFSSIGGPPVSGPNSGNQGPTNGTNASLTSWSSPNTSSGPNSVSASNADSRGNNASSSGPQTSQEDKKPQLN